MFRRTMPTCGVQGLSAFLAANAPKATTVKPISTLRGKKIAIDASLSLLRMVTGYTRYQADNFGNTTPAKWVGSNFHRPVSDANKKQRNVLEPSVIYKHHLGGLLTRVTWMLEQKITPVFVFDGKRPDLKSGTNISRESGRVKATKQLEEYRLRVKSTKRDPHYESSLLVRTQDGGRLTAEEFEEIKCLLRLCGIPIVEAPFEAEAQCAELAKGGLVYAVASDDADTLAFGAPKQLRHLYNAERSQVVREIRLAAVLKSIKMSQANFVDLCILLGCDYCPRINGVGAKVASQIATNFSSLDSFLKSNLFLQLDLEYRIRQLDGKEKQDATNEIKKVVPFFLEKRGRDFMIGPPFSHPAKPKLLSKLENGGFTSLKATKSSIPDPYPYSGAQKLFFQHPVISALDLKSSNLSLQEPKFKELRAYLEIMGVKVDLSLDHSVKKLRAAYKKSQKN